jgi:hypothetical protein
MLFVSSLFPVFFFPRSVCVRGQHNEYLLQKGSSHVRTLPLTYSELQHPLLCIIPIAHT